MHMTHDPSAYGIAFTFVVTFCEEFLLLAFMEEFAFLVLLISSVSVSELTALQSAGVLLYSFPAFYMVFENGASHEWKWKLR